MFLSSSPTFFQEKTALSNSSISIDASASTNTVKTKLYDPQVLYPKDMLDRNVKEMKEAASLLIGMWPLLIKSACEKIANATKNGLLEYFDPFGGDQNCQIYSFIFVENYPLFAMTCMEMSKNATEFLQNLPKHINDILQIGDITDDERGAVLFREVVQESKLMEFLQQQDRILLDIRNKLIMDNNQIKHHPLKIENIFLEEPLNYVSKGIMNLSH